MVGKKIIALIVLILIGQIVGLVFYFFVTGFETELFIPMAVSSVLVWLLYLQQQDRHKKT